MCKKGEIVQENIEIQMRLVTRVRASDDDSFDEDNLGSSDEEDNGDFMARCQSLTYNVEIGELHERDKFTWIEQKGVGRRNVGTLEDKKLKQLDFKFKLNHIKQVVSVLFWLFARFSDCTLLRLDKSGDLWVVQAKERVKARRGVKYVR